MKFVKLKREKTNSSYYNSIERNDWKLDMLGSFLTDDAYGDAYQFLEWLSNIPEKEEHDSIGGYILLSYMK